MSEPLKGICEPEESDKLKATAKKLIGADLDDIDSNRLEYYVALSRRLTRAEADRIYSIDGQVKRRKTRQARAISM